jgi:hypothetical protein
MQYYVAFLIGSQLNIGSLYLIFIAYVFFQKFWKLDTSFASIEWQYILLLLLGISLALLYINNYTEAYYDKTNIFLNMRKHFIQIFFAIALYEFFKDKEINYVLKTLYYSIIPNIILGSYQFITNFPERIDMFFLEPSSAGYYYLFIFFILLEKFKNGMPYWITRYYMILGLAIGSKAQIILLSLVGILKYSSPLKLILFLSITLSFFYGFYDEIMSIEAVQYNLKVFKIYWEEGLSGLRVENGVWGTYVTRLSAIQGAFVCMLEHPFGIGFGGYNSWYSTNMVNIGFSSSETDMIIYGGGYATPKSNLLGFFVSTGIIGIILYLYWLKSFIQIGGYLLQSFITLTFASMFIELNPMFAYLMILFILKEKEESNKLKKEEKNR